jgi:hypothetical protein
MKISNPRIVYAWILFLAACFASCKTELVYLTVHEPAPVSLPGGIKKVGILNRSLPIEENKVMNTIGMVLSEKGPELDKEGAKESIRGLKDALMQNNRFTDIIQLDNLEMHTTANGIFPSPLSWEVIEKICVDNQLDALFVLELFDTDSKVSYAAIPTKINTPLGQVPAVEQQATMVTQVKTGWRIYDPAGRRILDEIPITKTLTFSGRGVNPLVAAAALMNRKDAVKQAGYGAGQIYANRILPYSIRVNRDYYVKGNYNFKIAKRKARTGNWDGAAELWLNETKNPGRKVRGRACYNMAIISEINGDLDNAMNWAQKAYEEDNNKLALRYLNILKYRKAESERLKRQADEASK